MIIALKILFLLALWLVVIREAVKAWRELEEWE